MADEKQIDVAIRARVLLCIALTVAAVLLLGKDAMAQGNYCFIVLATNATKQQLKTTFDGIEAIVDPRETNGLAPNHPDFWAHRWVLAGTAEQRAVGLLMVNADVDGNSANLLDRLFSSLYRRITFANQVTVQDMIRIGLGNAYWNDGCTHGWVLTPGEDPSTVPDPLSQFVPIVP